MRKNFKILNIVLIVLIVFFGSAVISNIWVQYFSIKPFGFYFLKFIFLDLLNIFFVIAIIIARQGLILYMKLDKFNFKQALLYRQSGVIFILYTICNSFVLVYNQVFLKIKLHEYGVDKLSQYFIIALIGFVLIILSDFIRNASRIQQENDLTI
jgi:hypothetical protein